jgi:LPS sulfotransferase NodH
VTVLGEIFGNPEAIEWGTSEFPVSRQAHRTYKDNVEDFLETHIFRKLSQNTEACGFKIFYYHAQEEPKKRIWKRLRELDDIRVIHVKRRNILRTHLSREKAVRSNQWVSLSNERRDDLPISLNYEECLNAFIQTKKWEQEYDAFFQESAIREIYYEDLIENTTREMAEVQEFLGLSIEPVAPQTYQQSSAPISNAIENYSELKVRFQDTEWAYFFED